MTFLLVIILQLILQQMTNKQLSKFNLVLCELHNPQIHGKNSTSNVNIESNYLIISRFNADTYYPLNTLDNFNDEYEYTYEDKLDYVAAKYNLWYSVWHSSNINKKNVHPLFCNYMNIISNYNYIKPEIGLCIELPTFERIVILKTFWLRIIQKTWKKTYQQRIDIINFRKRRINIDIYGN